MVMNVGKIEHLVDLLAQQQFKVLWIANIGKSTRSTRA